MTPLTVLYVDDDPDIREIAVLSLGLDPGVTAHAADSGRAALDLLDAGLRPDVIVSDVMMPQMDGPKVLAEVRARAPVAETPVIFITARAQTAEHDRFIALGAKGVIVKPFDPIRLPALVRGLLERP